MYIVNIDSIITRNSVVLILFIYMIENALQDMNLSTPPSGLIRNDLFVEIILKWKVMETIHTS